MIRKFLFYKMKFTVVAANFLLYTVINPSNTSAIIAIVPFFLLTPESWVSKFWTFLGIVMKKEKATFLLKHRDIFPMKWWRNLFISRNLICCLFSLSFLAVEKLRLIVMIRRFLKFYCGIFSVMIWELSPLIGDRKIIIKFHLR